MLTQKELQENLKISQATYYRFIKEGMPFIVNGKKKLFDIKAVTEWMEERNNSSIGELHVGEVYSNAKIAEAFKCSTQGGMRRAHATNTLVLFTDHSNVENVYEDKWRNNILHYTGMGLTGDQKLEGTQNQTLADSNGTSIRVYLFETFISTEHTFSGEVVLISDPYQIEEKDQDGYKRRVWKFPLKIKNESKAIEKKTLDLIQQKKQHKLLKLSPEEIAERAEKASKINKEEKISKTSSEGTKEYKAEPSSRTVNTRVFDRDPNIAAYVKQMANGKCQLCEENAPFKDENGKPYLESHHIHWLSNGGLDIIENSIALCANCHRKMHVIAAHSDVEKLKNSVLKYTI